MKSSMIHRIWLSEKRILSIFTLFLSLFFVLPSEARKRHTINLSRDYQSVVVNEDSTVDFCYCGVGQQVYLQSDLFYADEDPARYTDRTRLLKMTRLSDGCFHVTTKAVQPETYTYCFRVNGKRKPDPFNPDTAWQMMHKWNVLTVGRSEESELYQQPAEQGTLIRTCWYSSAEKLCRRVHIYLPAGYNKMSNDQCQMTNDKYPVLYLIHGINGYEGSWSERGRAIQILENQVSEGLCEPMILVMPDVNFGVHEDRPSHHTLWNNVFNYPRLCHDHDIEKALVELIQMVDTTYRVSDQHYIAGFSDGARLAANTANLLPGYFSSVGLFSPVVHKDQLPEAASLLTFHSEAVSLPVYYIYTGKRDMFHNNAKRFNRRLTKSQAPHEYTETSGGHTWRNWRLYLSDFLLKINP